MTEFVLCDHDFNLILSVWLRASVCACVCMCVYACVRACVRECVCARVRTCVHARVCVKLTRVISVRKVHGEASYEYNTILPVVEASTTISINIKTRVSAAIPRPRSMFNDTEKLRVS